MLEMQSPILFDRPGLLLLWPLLVAVFWAVGRRSYAGLHPATQQLALVTRSLVAGLLVLALAGMHVVQRSDTLTTIFLVDASKSIRQGQFQDAKGTSTRRWERSASPTGRRDCVRADGLCRRCALVGTSNVDGLRRYVAGDATDLRDALRTAQTAFGAGMGK